MSNFTNKIDFISVITVTKANPNGDPLNGNRPREDYNGYGEISDVCIKRKIRNRLQDMGESIFVQSAERCDDKIKSLSERAQSIAELKAAAKSKDKDTYADVACKQWFDVRAFGQVFAFKADNVSVGVRGPVSVHTAVSVAPVDISSMQITKSVNSEPKEGKSSDTMGTKHRVDFGVYILKGSINHQLAEKTGFSDEDAVKIKEALSTLFENDSSSARPDGSMEVKKLYWFKHNCPMGQYSSAKVHNSVSFAVKEGVDVPKSYEDFVIDESNMFADLECEIIEGR
jgi:CRISPR-associated protein Csd2